MGTGNAAVGGTDEKMMLRTRRSIEDHHINLWTRGEGGNERR